MLLTTITIFIAGGLGTLARWGVISTLISVLGSGQPTTLLAIGLCNTMGSFVAGFLIALPDTAIPHLLRLALSVGLLGGFTTFSALMVDIVLLARIASWTTLGIYAVATLLLGIAAVFMGYGLAHGYLSGTR